MFGYPSWPLTLFYIICPRTIMIMYAADTPISVVEEMFNSLSDRDDIGIILINQHVRDQLIRGGKDSDLELK